jgi:DNA segregation ATPase FtsK/SpoIIIE-like protein
LFKDKRYQEITGIILILVSIIILLSIFTWSRGDVQLLASGSPVKNLIGPLGAWMSHVLRSAFGIASYLLVAVCALAGWAVMMEGGVMPVMERIFSLFFLAVTMSALASAFGQQSPHVSGGYIGAYLHSFLGHFLGKVGAYLVIAILNLSGLILMGIMSLSSLVERAGSKKYLSRGISSLGRYFMVQKTKQEIPLNNIETALARHRKPPWITRKIIRIYDGTEPVMDKKDTLKYLEMSVPLASRDETLVPGRMDSYRDRLREFTSTVTPERDIRDAIPAGIPDNNGENFIDDDILDDHDTLITADDIYCEDEPAEQIPAETSADDDETEQDYPIQDHNEDRPGTERDIIANRITCISEEKEEEDDTVIPDVPEEVVPVALRESLFSSPEETVPDKRVFEEIPINKEYIIPTIFLNSSEPMDSESWKIEIRKNSMLLVNTLSEFGIESKVVNVNRGPVITLYEMQIAPGIKVNRIVGLSDDIALALAAYRVRIVAPIPGKAAIGVEIPNRDREMVTLGDIIKSEEYQTRTGCLKVGLGKDILGKPITLDLKRLPHLLIAGATGAGKSVSVNSIICSLIYNYNPNYVRFIMVDPKMVELQLYNGLPHLLTPVITEPHIAPIVLKWAIYEMERRYRLLSALTTRDIERYNEKIHLGGDRGEKLPYIVIIIDEMADLMMVAPKEMEGYITRLAQKARAIGIHLVLATQRPSVDVITGIIKANFPARIAFQVAQKTDSRTIIDQNGAEKLLGKGDMLYQSPMSSFPVRIQGAFISEDEIAKVVEHLGKFGEPNYIDIEQSLYDSAEDEREAADDDDELFVEALKIVEETRKASASYLQRRLSIGYNRAARIIELMEDRGYIGPQQGSKPRDVLI